MLVLLPENRSFDLDLMPDIVDDLHFGVLDNSSPDDPDYIFPPLVYMESFSQPTIKLRIGEYPLSLPVDFQILIGEPAHGDLEVIPAAALNDRDFKAFALNPLSSFRPDFLQLDIEDVLPAVRWHMPKLRTGQLLCVPLRSGPKPPCVYVVKDLPKAFEIIGARGAW